MSKICYLAVFPSDCDRARLKKTITRELNRQGLYPFFDFEYQEPFTRELSPDHVIVSIADNQAYDNCEMLLLPDSWSFQGAENPVPYINRMEGLMNAIMQISAFSIRIDLFIGESGLEYSDFMELKIDLASFLDLIESIFRSNYNPAVHFIFSQSTMTGPKGLH